MLANCSACSPANSGQSAPSALNDGDGLWLAVLAVFVVAEVFTTTEKGLGLRHIYTTVGATHHVLGGRTFCGVGCSRALQAAEISSQQPIDYKYADENGQ